MVKKKHEFPSTFTIDNFSSTATLAKNDHIKVPIRASIDSIQEKEYNPYDHREVDHPNTFSGALIHLLKSALGTGILAIPRAFKTAGLAVGTIGTILIGILCTHTIHILVAASQEVCKRTKTPSLGYAETAEAVFECGPRAIRGLSKTVKYAIEVALILTYYLGNSVYIVFISESITKLLGFYYPEAESWSQYVKLAILLPLILCCQVRELKHLVPFSFIANATMFTAVGITMYYMFSEIDKVNVSDRKAATSIYSLPSFFSTVVFAMEGIGTIMPVENSMIKDHFIGCPGVLNIAMAMVVGVYTTMGLFGYLAFGDKTEATITKNLPSDEIPAQVVQACISAAVFFTFMLQFYVPMDVTWRNVRDRIPESRHNIAQIIMRTTFVCVVVAVAAAAGTHLGALIDLVGALFLATLGIVVPAILDIIVRWRNWGTLGWILVKDILLLIFGLFGTISGSYYAVLNFVKEE